MYIGFKIFNKSDTDNKQTGGGETNERGIVERSVSKVSVSRVSVSKVSCLVWVAHY